MTTIKNCLKRNKVKFWVQSSYSVYIVRSTVHLSYIFQVFSRRRRVVFSLRTQSFTYFIVASQGQRRNKSNEGRRDEGSNVYSVLAEKGGCRAKYQWAILQSKQDGTRHGLSPSECNKLFPVVQHFSFLSWAGVTLAVSPLAGTTLLQTSAPMSLPSASCALCMSGLQTGGRKAILRVKERI